MKKLGRLKKERAKWRKKRDRQYRKYLKAKKQGKSGKGHRRAFRAAKAEITALNKKIKQEKKRLDLQEVIPREEWDAAPPNGSYSRQTTPKAGVQHHTAMPTLSAKATKAEECQRMRDLQGIHLRQGWTDLGYCRVAFPSGRVYEGRPSKYVGAHTLGHNTGYMGWALDGNYDINKPTKAAVAACHRIRVELGVGNKPLYGHHQLNATACPGKYLKPYLNKEI
jgi:hypothetical protein